MTVWYTRPDPNFVVPSTDFSGVIVVTTAGTPVTGPDVSAPYGFILEGHPSNTQNVHVFAASGAASDAFALDALQDITLHVANLSSLKFNADVNGEQICWVKA